MINASELRRGNIVEASPMYEHLFPNGIVVHSIGDFYIQNKDFKTLTYNQIDPIPLTPEILKKAGFVIPAGNYSYTVVKDGVIKYKFEMGFYHTFIIGNTIFSHIKYVHQLQNLYFALTGEELEINL